MISQVMTRMALRGKRGDSNRKKFSNRMLVSKSDLDIGFGSQRKIPLFDSIDQALNENNFTSP